MRTTLRVFAYLKRYPALAAGQLFCAIVGVLCGVLVFPEAAKKVTDVVIPERRADLLGFWVGVSLLAYFGRDLLNSLRIRLNNTFEQKVIFDLRSDLYARLQRLPLPWFDGRPTGDIMTTISEDVTSVERVLIDGIEQGAVALMQILVVAVILFQENTALAGWALVPIPFLILGAGLYTTSSRTRHKAVRQASSAMNSLLMDNIGGIRQIKAYTREEAEHGRFNGASDRLRQATLRVMKAWSVYSPGMAFFAACGTVLILWFGGKAGIAGEMTGGQLIKFLILLGLFYEPINRLHSLNQIIQAGRAAGDRVFDILDTAEEEDPAEATHHHQIQKPVLGHVEYRGVSFAYSERIATLSDVTLEARPGETIALVGPTGAGKSTIINLLCRFYELDEKTGGDILLDGHKIRDITKSSLRGAIGFVTQESFLFNGTVRDNLALAKPKAVEKEVWAALDAANAGDFVRRLPEGLDTEVGERGVRLSVGEKQRISIARALLKNPPILLLDEATASVDTETERQIQQALDRLMEGRTSFVIAHRLSTVRHASRIYVLDRGKVVESGNHDQLLALGGLYAELCRYSLLSGEEAENATLAPQPSASALATQARLRGLTDRIGELERSLEQSAAAVAEKDAAIAQWQNAVNERDAALSHARNEQTTARSEAERLFQAAEDQARQFAVEKQALNERLAAEKQELADRLATEHAAALERAMTEERALTAHWQKLSAQNEEALTVLQDSHRSAVEKLASEHESKVLQLAAAHTAALESVASDHSQASDELRKAREAATTALEAEIASLREKADAFAKSAAEEKERHEALQGTLEARTAEISALTERLSAHETGAAEKSTELAAAREQIGALMAQFSEKSAEIAASAAQLGQLRAQIAEKDAALAAANRELETVRIEAAAAAEVAAIPVPPDGSAEHEAVVTQLKSDLSKEKKLSTRLDRDLQSSEERRLLIESELLHTREAMDELRAGIDALKAESAVEKDTLKQRLEELERQHAEDEAKLALLAAASGKSAASASAVAESAPSAPSAEHSARVAQLERENTENRDYAALLEAEIADFRAENERLRAEAAAAAENLAAEPTPAAASVSGDTDPDSEALTAAREAAERAAADAARLAAELAEFRAENERLRAESAAAAEKLAAAPTPAAASVSGDTDPDSEALTAAREAAEKAAAETVRLAAELAELRAVNERLLAKSADAAEKVAAAELTTGAAVSGDGTSADSEDLTAARAAAEKAAADAARLAAELAELRAVNERLLAKSADAAEKVAAAAELTTGAAFPADETAAQSEALTAARAAAEMAAADAARFAAELAEFRAENERLRAEAAAAAAEKLAAAPTPAAASVSGDTDPDSEALIAAREAAERAAADAAREKKLAARLDRDLQSSEERRLMMESELLRAREDLDEWRSRLESAKADASAEQDELLARLDELEKQRDEDQERIALLSGQVAAGVASAGAASVDLHSDAAAAPAIAALPMDISAADGDSAARLAELERQLSQQVKRISLLDAELALVRSENDRLRSITPTKIIVGPDGMPVAPPSVPTHPELPLRIPSRPLVVFTSRG